MKSSVLTAKVVGSSSQSLICVNQTVSPAEVIVREKWAFETSEVENELTPIWDGQ